LSADPAPSEAVASAGGEPQLISAVLTVPPLPPPSPRRRALFTVAALLSVGLHASSLAFVLNWRESADLGATGMVTEAISVEIVESKVLEAMLNKQSSEPAPSVEATAPREGSVDATAAAREKPVEKPEEVAHKAPKAQPSEPQAVDDKTRVVVVEAPQKPDVETLPLDGPGEKKELVSAVEATQAKPKEQEQEAREKEEKEAKHKKEEQQRKEEVARQEREKEKKDTEAKIDSRAGGVTSRASEGKGVGAQRASASTGAIMSYATKVRAQVARHKPTGRRTRGTAIVSFAITHTGELAFADVSRSSGSQTLDQAALAAVRGSAPFPTPPVGATAAQLHFSIPFQFQ
jgi:protein TonB